MKKIYITFFLSVAFAFLGTSSVGAADARNYNAGRIIDDAVFTNNDAMTVPQIQQFLNSKTVCDTWGRKTSELGGGTRAQWLASRGISTPITCLRDYHENPSNGANNYGRAIPAGAISAAQIIYNYSQQFGINPQVLLVTLQKENGLITDEWPTPKQYSESMGFGCPDNVAPGAPACDPSFGSFSAQIYQAARHFRGYINNSPGWWIPFNTGNNAIRWSPNAACGSGNVNIENRSTVALYSYTPYQPNQAAKNAQYGTGDGCSAYGNRNFYLYFNDWFGATNGAQDLLSDGSSIYYISNGYKYYIPSMEHLYNYGYTNADAARIIRTSPVELNKIPNGNGFTNISVVMASERQGIFIISNGYKYYVPTMDLLYSYGFKDTDIMLVSDQSLNRFKVASQLGRFIHDTSGFAYIVDNGKRRGIYQLWVLGRYADSATSNLMSNVTMASIPRGIPMVDGRLALTYSGVTYISIYDKWFTVSSAEVASCIGVEGIVNMDPNKTLPGVSVGSIDSCYVKDENNNKYLLDGKVKYQLNANDEIQYSTIHSSNNIASMVTVPFEEHKNIFATNEGIYKLESGKIRHLQSMQYVRDALGKDNVPVLNVNSLRSVQKGANIYQNGTLISSPNKGIYLMDDGEISYISSMDVFNAYGFKLNQIIGVSDQEIEKQPKGSVLSGAFVRCDNKNFIISNGVKYEVKVTDVDHFGGESRFTGAGCGALSRLGEMTRFVTTQGNRNIYYIENKTKRHILSWSTFVSMGGTSEDVIFVDASTFNSFSNGATL
jgi:hypothetical protein